MERKKEEGGQVIQTAREIRSQASKKVYRGPELREWGSIEDLTRGGPKPPELDGAGFTS